MSTIQDISWFMKHKPLDLKNYVFETENQKQTVNQWFKNESIDGNILLYGPGGVGKTVLAELLIRRIIKSQYDLKRIRSRSVQEVDELFNWVQKTPVKSKKKVVYFEEFDKISGTAQTTLKDGLLESFQQYVSFVCTTNYANKLDPMLLSRFNNKFNLTGSNVEGITTRLSQILQIEHVTFDNEKLYQFVQNNHTIGLRNLITTLQVNSLNGKIDFDSIDDEVSNAEEIIVNNTLEILKYLLETSDHNQKRLIMMQPLNSQIAKQYSEILETAQFSQDMHWETIFMMINDRVQFLPVKMLVSKYMENLETKKLPHLHYLSFLYETIKMVLEVNI